jgi:putative protease
MRMKMEKKKIHILVQNTAQLKAVLESRLCADRIILDIHMLTDEGDIPEVPKDRSNDVSLYCALPYMTRNEAGLPGTDDIAQVYDRYKGFLDGFLVRNLEQAGFLIEDGIPGFSGGIYADYGLYIWNSRAADFVLTDMGISEACIPYELNLSEIRDLVRKTSYSGCSIKYAMNIYGRIPMMVSAGCLRKTSGRCSGLFGSNHTSYISITDRKKNQMPVMTDCRNCLNVIYNSVPTSLHKMLSEITALKEISSFRIDFTDEDAGLTGRVCNFYASILEGETADVPFSDYTTGHLKRGVE